MTTSLIDETGEPTAAARGEILCFLAAGCTPSGPSPTVVVRERGG